MTWGCSDCGMRSASMKAAHCQFCHRQFASMALADKHHLFGERRRVSCVDPATVTTKAGVPVFRLVDGVWRSHAMDSRWVGMTPLSPAEQAIVDRFEAACAVCDGYGELVGTYVPSGQERQVGKVGVPTLIPCPVCAPDVP